MFPETFRYPVAKRLVDETDCRLDWPEANKLPVWRYPDAVRFVPEAFVNDSPVIVPEGVLSSVDDAVPKNCRVFVLVTKAKVDEAANEPLSLYWI